MTSSGFCSYRAEFLVLAHVRGVVLVEVGARNLIELIRLALLGLPVLTGLHLDLQQSDIGVILSSVALAALCLLFGFAAPLFGLDSYLQDIEVRSLTAASAPRFLGNRVLLTYQSGHRVRLVGARFAHEDYRVFHTYSRNENGVFLLLLEVPADVEELRYRITVDGIWTSDPNSPAAATDAFGTAFSVFPLRGRPTPPLRSPVVDEGGRVTFVFRSDPGRRVYLTGDFNQWDPFWEPMREVRPGLYQTSLRLGPGRHYYRFSVDGNRLLDPLNLDSARDPEGHSVSVVDVPAQPAVNLSLYQSAPQ